MYNTAEHSGAIPISYMSATTTKESIVKKSHFFFAGWRAQAFPSRMTFEL